MAQEELLLSNQEFTKSCRYCGALFTVKASQADKRFNCSQDCMAAEYRNRMRGSDNPNYRNAGQKVCRQCGEHFESYAKTAKYCSVACRGLSQRKASKVDASHLEPWQRGLACRLVLCKACMARFVYPVSRIYCQVCWQERSANAREVRSCVICQAPFPVYKTVVKHTCSPECSLEYRSVRQRGELSHRWRGGKTDERTLQRTSADYARWRSSVFERDAYTCFLCKERGGKLAAHHIKPVRLRPELIFAVENGITLCWSCHRGIHWKEAEYEAAFLAHTARF